MFYDFDQNNSYGYFVVDDKLCHRLFIEADNFDEAKSIAESIGCYWDGVVKGIDCPCCGDRWDDYECVIDINKYNEKGYEVGVYEGIYPNTIEEWNKRYGKYSIFESPSFKQTYSSVSYSGKICFKDIEDYAQFVAEEHGWTSPDVRIYYKDGSVKEFTGRTI